MKTIFGICGVIALWVIAMCVIARHFWRSSPFESSINSDAAWTEEYVSLSQRIALDQSKLQTLANSRIEACTVEGKSKGKPMSIQNVGGIYRCVLDPPQAAPSPPAAPAKVPPSPASSK